MRTNQIQNVQTVQPQAPKGSLLCGEMPTMLPLLSANILLYIFFCVKKQQQKASNIIINKMIPLTLIKSASAA